AATDQFLGCSCGRRRLGFRSKDRATRLRTTAAGGIRDMAVTHSPGGSPWKERNALPVIEFGEPGPPLVLCGGPGSPQGEVSPAESIANRFPPLARDSDCTSPSSSTTCRAIFVSRRQIPQGLSPIPQWFLSCRVFLPEGPTAYGLTPLPALDPKQTIGAALRVNRPRTVRGPLPGGRTGSSLTEKFGSNIADVSSPS